MTRPTWYDGAMRFPGLLLSLSAFLLTVACGDDDDRPAVCRGEVEPHTLPMYAPCSGDFSDVCADGGTCINNFCSQPCETAADCTEWDGFTAVCNGETGTYCEFLCKQNETPGAADDACPEVDGVQLTCGRFFCQGPYPCD